MSIFTRPVLEINLNNLIDNYLKLKQIIAPAKPSAVVKDDAYGLNAEIIAKTLYEKAGCRDFWVAHAVEGAKIAPLFKNANIYVLQGIGEDSSELFEKHHLIPVISSPEMLEFWKNPRWGDDKMRKIEYTMFKSMPFDGNARKDDFHDASRP